MSGEPALLELQGLRVEGSRPILRGLDFRIGRAERVALIGRSGSGKSMTALSCLGLLPPGLRFESSKILVDGVDLLELPEKQRLGLRGRRIGIVFQQASAALNPVWTVGFQLRELCSLYFPEKDARVMARRLMDDVGLEDEALLRAYPHELSGGQRQRVLLAMALAGKPDLLLADEITASLDLVTQAEILDLLDRLCRERGLALLLISHDLSTIFPRSDRIMVIEEGMIVEEAPTKSFEAQALHPLSQRFLRAARGEDPEPEASRPGSEVGCPYAGGCIRFQPECARKMPDLREFDPGHRCRCFFAGDPS